MSEDSVAQLKRALERIEYKVDEIHEIATRTAVLESFKETQREHNESTTNSIHSLNDRMRQVELSAATTRTKWATIVAIASALFSGAISWLVVKFR